MANVPRMKRPYTLLKYEIFYLDRSKMLSKGRRSVDMWHDYCDSDILSDKGKLQVISLGLYRDCQRKTLTK